MCVCVCARGDVGFISGQLVGCFKEGWRGGSSGAPGPVYHPSYLSPRQPPWGRPRECTDEREPVRCELEYEGNHNRRARRRGGGGGGGVTGDKRGWGERKVQREVGQWRERERGRRREGVTGDCCSGSDRKWKADRRKDEEVHWYSTADRFFTLEGRYLTLLTLPFTLTHSSVLCILCRLPADARSPPQRKTNNGCTMWGFFPQSVVDAEQCIVFWDVIVFHLAQGATHSFDCHGNQVMEARKSLTVPCMEQILCSSLSCRFEEAFYCQTVHNVYFCVSARGHFDSFECHGNQVKGKTWAMHATYKIIHIHALQNNSSSSVSYIYINIKQLSTDKEDMVYLYAGPVYGASSNSFSVMRNKLGLMHARLYNLIYVYSALNKMHVLQSVAYIKTCSMVEEYTVHLKAVSVRSRFDSSVMGTKLRVKLASYKTIHVCYALNTKLQVFSGSCRYCR